MVSATIESLLFAPKVQGMLEAAAHRAGIADGVGILDADDVASELQEKALKAALAFDPTRGFKFTTYLWPLIWGKAVDLRRRYGRKDRSGHSRPIELPLLDEAVDRPSHLALDFFADHVTQSVSDGLELPAMIRQLPMRERAAFLLREIGGVSAGEIGQTLGLSDGKTKALRRQAVRRLRVAAERPR